jgi:hypothetical protein
MRIRAVAVAGVATLVIVGAAVAPVWMTDRGPQTGPDDATVVPFELSGLYVSDCGIGRGESDDPPADCAGPYRLGQLTASPSFDGFHRAMYYGYLAAELVPCLRAHGLEVDLPSQQDVRRIDVSAWYLTVVMRPNDFHVALSAWYECPLIPSYLEDAAEGEAAVME